MKRKLKIDSKDDWARFAIGYLQLAELACLEITEKKYTDDKSKFRIEEIYIPALFNLKHGIEIFLKTFIIEFLNKEYLDQSDYSHNIEEIFSKFRQNIKEERLESAIKKFRKENPDAKDSLRDKNIFNELEKIVKKYHNLNPLKEKIGTDYLIRDTENTALKYPTNNLNICIDYGKVSKKFTEQDALESLLDSITLQTIFWNLYTLLYTERM